MAVKWLDEPEDHDYDAAADYLSMLVGDATVAADENTPIPCRLASWMPET